MHLLNFVSSQQSNEYGKSKQQFFSLVSYTAFWLSIVTALAFQTLPLYLTMYTSVKHVWGLITLFVLVCVSTGIQSLRKGEPMSVVLVPSYFLGGYLAYFSCRILLLYFWIHGIGGPIDWFEYPSIHWFAYFFPIGILTIIVWQWMVILRQRQDCLKIFLISSVIGFIIFPLLSLIVLHELKTPYMPWIIPYFWIFHDVSFYPY